MDYDKTLFCSYCTYRGKSLDTSTFAGRKNMGIAHSPNSDTFEDTTVAFVGKWVFVDTNPDKILLQIEEEVKNSDTRLVEFNTIKYIWNNPKFIEIVQEYGIEFISAGIDHEDSIIYSNALKHWREITEKKIAEAEKKPHNDPLKMSQANKKHADEFAINMKTIIKDLKAEGFKSTRELAAELSKRKILTPRKKETWTHTSVYNIIKRIKKLDP